MTKEEIDEALKLCEAATEVAESGNEDLYGWPGETEFILAAIDGWPKALAALAKAEKFIRDHEHAWLTDELTALRKIAEAAEKFYRLYESIIVCDSDDREKCSPCLMRLAIAAWRNLTAKGEV